MSKTAWSSVAALVVILGIVGVLTGGSEKQLTVTSFGRLPAAYGALFDLLTELDLPVARSYAPARQLPRQSPAWWIQPSRVCGPPSRAAGAHPSTETDGATEETSWDGPAWITAGGTAVVFLPELQTKAPCTSIAGLAVPGRVEPKAPNTSDADAAETQDGSEQEQPSGLRRRLKGPRVTQVIEGAIVPRPRQVEGNGFAAFADVGAWQLRATLDGRPFVLEQGLGSGRLVLVADAAVLSNAWLKYADAAPFAVDLVRAFGAPRFDERRHGLRAADSAVLYLAMSPAGFVFAGLALIGLVFAWRGTAWPARTVVEPNTAAPTLEGFVRSMADLYARTGDHGRVLQRYRDLSVSRLRRHFGLPPDTPRAILIERLRATRRIAPAGLQLLAADLPPGANEAALRARVRALDALVQEASR